MADQESQLITDLTSTPIVKHQAIETQGRERIAIATLALTSLDAADVIRFVRVPSRARVTAVEVLNDAVDSNATPTVTASIGLYTTDGGAAVSDALFTSANTVLQAANKTYKNVLDAVAAADADKVLWDLLGDTSDPGVDYDVAITVGTKAATFAAGSVAVRVKYVVPET